MNNAPIGIFDSGFGGLTVARAIAQRLPEESLIYFGDTARCPYGPRSLPEVRRFVMQICTWLTNQQVKLIVIACNTATAAGLMMAQQQFDVPIIGVVEPGARAAVRSTRTRRIAVIATQATVDSDAYAQAIRALDAGALVYSQATPMLVTLVENGLREDPQFTEHIRTAGYGAIHYPEKQAAVEHLVGKAVRPGVDTLVMGCTHFPVIEPLIQAAAGPDIRLISSSTETARDVAHTLEYRDDFAEPGHVATHRFATTSSDPAEFRHLGTKIFGEPLSFVEYVEL